MLASFDPDYGNGALKVSCEAGISSTSRQRSVSPKYTGAGAQKSV
jgi:hypothetical protein